MNQGKIAFIFIILIAIACLLFSCSDLSREKIVDKSELTGVIGNEKYIIFGKMEYIRISNNDASFSVTMVHRFR